MAKKLKDEDLVLNIIVNGDKGRAEMKQLERAITDTKLQLSALEAEKKKLTAAGKQNTIEWHANERAITKANNAISQAEERLKILRNGMKLTDMSIRDLISEQTRLRGLMNTSAPGSENWIKYRNELKLVQNRLRELRGEAQRAGISISQTADRFNRYMGMVAAFAGSFAMGVMGLRKANEAYAEHDDKLADVMKTTGLTKEQVAELNSELAKIDTRTAQIELLDLARQAGKLGITAKDDVEAFVVAADKIGVALGEDLGGKEEAINKMGKLVDLFKIKDEYGMADGMLKVGSAVNALGAASTANEGYIVEFTSRVGGIALSSNISAANVMGLAATFDSLNAQSEASSTVINKVVVGMFKNTSEYAKVAGMDVKAFKDLLASDSNEGLLRVLEGFKGADLGVTASLLGEVGENGARAAQAVSLIAGNIDVVRKQQSLANEEFIKGTGVVNEFNTKNETAQAKLEKARKKAQENLVELGREIQPLMSGVISSFGTLIKLLSGSIKFIIEYKAAITGITVALLALVAAQKLQNNWDKITVAWGKLKAFWSNTNTIAILRETVAISGNTAATVTYTTAQKGLIAVKALLVGQFKAAGIAAKAFFASIGPVGWIIAGVTLLGGAIGYLAGRTTDAAKAKNRFDDAHSKVSAVSAQSEALSNVKSKMDDLIATYNRLYPKTNKSQEENNKLKKTIEDIIRIMPSAATRFDEYGKAISISTNKVNAACESERKYFLWKNRDTVDELVEGASDQFEEIIEMQQTLANVHERIKITGKQGYKLARGSSEYDVSIKQLAFQKNSIKEQSQLLHGFILDMERMGMTASEIALRISDETGAKFTLGALNSFKLAFETPEINSTIDAISTKCPKCGNEPCTCYKGAAVEKQKWTLENDQEFNLARTALKLKLYKGEIATEEEHNQKFLELEIATLEKRIASNKEKGADLSKLQQDLLDKRYAQLKKSNELQRKLQGVVDGGKSPVDQERIRYEKELTDLGLFGIARENMTELQLTAIIELERTHLSKLSSLHYNSLAEQFDDTQKAMKAELTELKRKQGDELTLVKTFADKKMLLSKYYSDAELLQITTDTAADKAIKSAYQKQEAETQEKHLRNMLNIYQSMMDEFRTKGSIFGQSLSAEDAAKLEEIIAQLESKLANLGANINLTPEKGNKVDILGMSADKWSELFTNFDKSANKVDLIAGAARAIGSAFSDVSNLMTAIEQREFKSYEKTQNSKKQLLSKRLKAGAISEEAYNSQVQAIDEQTDVKREEMERKQAERQKALAIFQILTNTAMAIMATIAQGGVFATPLIAVISALAAVQLATVIATPLPGAETGGMLVERAQDGKLFNAEYAPKKRGKVSKPTVIVGENGSEYVVPSEGYDNPTVRPVLNILESARMNGTLRQINLPALLASSQRGRANGGYASDNRKASDAPVSGPMPSDNNETAAVLLQLSETLRLLQSRLDNIRAYVLLTGPGSIKEAEDRYDKIRKNL